jgi:MFS family permease
MLATITVTISSQFNSLEQLSWIATTYALGCSVSQPLSGHLTDIFGRRAGLVACYILFMLGTLICGLSFYANSLWLLLAGRVLQGLGGGSLCSITSFIESDIVPLKKRPLIEGIGNVAYGATLAVGGFYGGAVHEAIGWQWAFLIQVPVIVIDALLVILVVHVPHQRSAATGKSIDYFGCILILLSMTFFQLGINQGSSSAWNNPLVITSLAISSAGFAAFFYWEYSKAPNPLLPIRHLLERTIASSQASYFFSNAAFSTVLFYVPIYLQALGASAEESGRRLIPYAAAFALGSFFAGVAVEKIGRYYFVNVIIQLFSLSGVICLCTMTADTQFWAPYVYLAVLGLGYGGGYVTRLMGLLTSADKETQAVIQAASWTVGSTGTALGIAVASVIFQKLSLDGLRVIFQGEPELLSAMQKSFGVLDTLPESVRQNVVATYLVASRGAFFFALSTIVAAAAASLAMKNNRISVSGFGEV